ncbi:Rrf2 family transcriptional regulator [Geochorda subterranea]|uniref:Rrf2 family transcriptional regulator n=1 Tax=Geochorda subterranea TaxID=3109564 RepID=A0ABZ1BMQ6_9FIRM|nr:Rrf2 family transcriptional regulator [Limnochorda sp. LNt]WRP13984.1 Rrf2 family transcriptional regulator [Limnochorda sp. LNt]
MDRDRLGPIHQEILRLLTQRQASYARPVSSAELGMELRVAPSYIRAQARLLRRFKLVSVRRGRGGGYYLNRANQARYESLVGSGR